MFLRPGFNDMPGLLARAPNAGVRRVVLLSGGAAIARNPNNPLSASNSTPSRRPASRPSPERSSGRTRSCQTPCAGSPSFMPAIPAIGLRRRRPRASQVCTSSRSRSAAAEVTDAHRSRSGGIDGEPRVGRRYRGDHLGHHVVASPTCLSFPCLRRRCPTYILWSQRSLTSRSDSSAPKRPPPGAGNRPRSGIHQVCGEAAHGAPVERARCDAPWRAPGQESIPRAADTRRRSDRLLAEAARLAVGPVVSRGPREAT